MDSVTGPVFMLGMPHEADQRTGFFDFLSFNPKLTTMPDAPKTGTVLQVRARRSNERTRERQFSADPISNRATSDSLLPLTLDHHHHHDRQCGATDYWAIGRTKETRLEYPCLSLPHKLKELDGGFSISYLDRPCPPSPFRPSHSRFARSPLDVRPYDSLTRASLARQEHQVHRGRLSGVPLRGGRRRGHLLRVGPE